MDRMITHLPALKIPFIVIAIVLGVTASISSVTASSCDVTVISGNVSITSGVVMTYISETEVTGSGVCSLEALGSRQITTGLDKKYFLCAQSTLSDTNEALNVSLQATVDIIADKPTSTTSFSGVLTCAARSLFQPELSTGVSILIVKINLVNDHPPTINGSAFVIDALPETFPYGADKIDLFEVYKLNVQARDGDTAGDESSRVTFSISEGNEDGTFAVETVTVNENSQDEYFVAQLFLVSPLDYHSRGNYSLTIKATDQGSPALSGTAILNISVKPGNTLGPAFDSNFYRATVNESDIDGKRHEISMLPDEIHAHDQDTGSDVGISYSILVDDCGKSCDAMKATFSVDEKTGIVTFDSSAPYGDIYGLIAAFGVKATGSDVHKRSTISIVTVLLPTSPSLTTTSEEPTTAAAEVTTGGSSMPTTCAPCPSVPTGPPAPEDTTVEPATATTPPSSVPTMDPVTDATTAGDQSSTALIVTTSGAVVSSDATSEHVPTTTPCECPTTPVIVTTACPSIETESPMTSDALTSLATDTSTQSSVFTTDPASASTVFPTCEPLVTTEVVPSTPAPPASNPYFAETHVVPADTVVSTVAIRMEYRGGTSDKYNYSASDCSGYSKGIEFFEIESHSGDVFVKKPLIADQHYCLNVTATSTSGINDQATGAVTIEVRSGSSEEIFAQNYYEVHIPENVQFKTKLLDLNSTYEEKNLMPVYRIETPIDPGLITIFATTGELYALKAFDHESQSLYKLLISASFNSTSFETVHAEVADVQFGNFSRNEALVEVFVDDVNDNAPVFDVGTNHSLGITAYLGQGQTVLTLKATDADASEEFNRIYYLMTDTTVPFFVNGRSGIVRATESLDVLQTKRSADHYDFQVTAANSEDGKVMPTNLQLTVYILKTDEILVMSTPKSVTDFDNLSSEIISIFKENLTVDARIIQWETNSDGSTVAYMYMLPLEETTEVRQKLPRNVGADSGPINKDQILRLIKQNAGILKDYFNTDTAKTYDDVRTPGSSGGSNSGLIAAVVVLSVLLGVGLLVGAVFGFIKYRKRNRFAHGLRTMPIIPMVSGEKPVVSTSSDRTDVAHNYKIGTNEENKYSYVDLETETTYEDIIIPEKTKDTSQLILAFESDSDRIRIPSTSISKTFDANIETCNKDVDHHHQFGADNREWPSRHSELLEQDGAAQMATSEPEPELDYLKSILVESTKDGDDKVKVQKSIVKFADVTEEMLDAEFAEIMDEKL